LAFWFKRHNNTTLKVEFIQLINKVLAEFAPIGCFIAKNGIKTSTLFTSENYSFISLLMDYKSYSALDIFQIWQKEVQRAFLLTTWRADDKIQPALAVLCNTRDKPPSSSGPGRGPLKAQTAVRVRLGAQKIRREGGFSIQEKQRSRLGTIFEFACP
jgi:hypothetical protein